MNNFKTLFDAYLNDTLVEEERMALFMLIASGKYDEEIKNSFVDDMMEESITQDASGIYGTLNHLVCEDEESVRRFSRTLRLRFHNNRTLSWSRMGNGCLEDQRVLNARRVSRDDHDFLFEDYCKVFQRDCLLKNMDVVPDAGYPRVMVDEPGDGLFRKRTVYVAHRVFNQEAPVCDANLEGLALYIEEAYGIKVMLAVQRPYADTRFTFARRGGLQAILGTLSELYMVLCNGIVDAIQICERA